MFTPRILWSALTSKNKASRHKIKRYAETGSPWRAPFSKLKYDAVVLALIIKDSWLSSNTILELNFKDGFMHEI